MYKALFLLIIVSVAVAQTIRQGSSGPDVVAVQYLLRHNGQGNVVADGQFNSATRDAVIAFQRGRGLTADGVVNADTITALGPTLRSGANGEAVRALQYLLRTKFGAGISVDGQFNAATADAVMNFQRARALDADAIVGRNTWNRLFGGRTAAPPPSGNLKAKSKVLIGDLVTGCSNLGPVTRYSAYRDGRNLGTIEVVRLQGRLVEKRTACAFLDMANAARSAGYSLMIINGFRTWEEQEHLYRCHRTGSCSSAGSPTPPGYQSHQNGVSLDFTVSGGVYAWLAVNAHTFGFVRTIPSENWHWEYLPGTPRASFT